jgi:hypothetical protein
MTEIIVDMDNATEKQAFWKFLRTLKGRFRFVVKEYRHRRTDRQNRYYWPCFVVPFAKYLATQYGRKNPSELEEYAHAILKDAHLRVPAVDTSTGVTLFNVDGDPLMRTRSTTELDTGEFNEYMDRCKDTLWELGKIEVPDPSVYHEREARKGKAA